MPWFAAIAIMALVLAKSKEEKMGRTLDRTKDFAEVCGLPGVRYHQDGISFGGNEQEIDPAGVTPINHELPKPSGRDDTPIHVAVLQTEIKEVDNATSSIENLEFSKLKKLVESYGGVFENRKQAIKFLKGGK